MQKKQVWETEMERSPANIQFLDLCDIHFLVPFGWEKNNLMFDILDNCKTAILHSAKKVEWTLWTSNAEAQEHR